MQKWTWNKTWVQTCDLDQRTTSHGSQAYAPQRCLGRNVRKTVILALYRPTSTSNINSLKEYESYIKMKLEQDLGLNLWPWPKNHEPWLSRTCWTQRYLGRNLGEEVILALYRPTSTSNINSLKEYESYAKMKLEQDLGSNLRPGPKITSHGSQGRVGHKD